jgi:hypothetical protein
MTEKKKTMLFAGVAIVLALLAFATAPRTTKPDTFYDLGEEFFPEFKDPNTATSLEVITFNEETGEAIPFKVEFKNGKWTIPSHHDYPADGKERLAKTAAGVIGIKKDDIRSDNVADHEVCGVIDPLDEKATTLKGRGQRVTIKGPNDKVLADLIIGKPVENREGFRFVRIPGQKRVYAARINLDISTKFSDWIEADLLQLDKNNISKIVLKDYSIDERSGAVNRRSEVKLEKDGSKWQINNLPAGMELNTSKVTDMLNTLDNLKIVGVRKKPAGLSANLKLADDQVKLSNSDLLSLQDKGYYFGRDGNLYSNEGEMEIYCDDGVIYTLRFGEVAYGSGLALSAGTEDSDGINRDVAENRYLFVTTRFDGSQFKEPKRPANTDFLNKPDSLWTDADKENKKVYDTHKLWEEKVTAGKSRSEMLNQRFADWYYVIPNYSFKKLDLSREDLLRKKTK